MSSSNGTLVLRPPTSHRRIDLTFETANQAAASQMRRHEEETADREQAERQHHDLAEQAGKMARAVHRYQAQLGAVRGLYLKARQEVSRPDITAAEKIMGDALLAGQIERHVEEMSAIMKEFLGEKAEVRRAIDADLKKIAAEIEVEAKGFEVERD